ncbi:MAG: hypothetical protein SFW09_14190, partial [Hyphomicrobiaceae bacterium]|nr:hypothetical protein [Hyphomicrobiaceae bacterium]
ACAIAIEEADRKARVEADKQSREAAERQRIAALEAARKAREEAAERLRTATLQTPGSSTSAPQPTAAAPVRQAPFAAGATETGLYAQSVAIASALVIAGGTGGGLRLWDTSANQIRPLAASHADAVAAVAVAADGQHFASGAWDGEIRIWETRSGALQHTIASPGPPVVALGYRTPQRLVAMHTNGSWSIIEPIRGQLLMRSTATADRKVSAADVALDGRTVIVALADGASPFSIEGWVPANGGVTTVTSRLTGHLDWVYAVASSPDIRRVASASADGTVRLWDWAAARELHRLSGHSSHVRALAFSRDGALVAGAADDGRMIVWSTSTGAVTARIDGPGSIPRALAFSVDGRTLTAASEDGQIRQWTVPVQP